MADVFDGNRHLAPGPAGSAAGDGPAAGPPMAAAATASTPSPDVPVP